MLIGKTITLKPLTREDAPLIAEWWSDPAYLGSSSPKRYGSAR